MANPMVSVVDAFKTKLDRLKVEVGVDYNSVTITGGALGFRLIGDEVEQFAAALVRATWRAAQQEEQMVAER